MTIDWNAKSTTHLKLILDSLLRYQGNAKTDREKSNTEKSIDAIKKVLRGRKNVNQQSI